MLHGGERILLDESAANTFANAKHLTVGKSGIPKMVSLILPHKDKGGDSTTNENKEAGKGFKSPNSFDLQRDN